MTVWLLAFGLVPTKGVVVGRVVKVRPHLGGEHIWLADVDIGTDCHPQIVWGGEKIVEEGSLVRWHRRERGFPWWEAKAGPYKIRRRRYRGEVSDGMLCSPAELGWHSSITDRVALLDESADLRPGQSLDNREGDWQCIVRPEIGHLASDSATTS